MEVRPVVLREELMKTYRDIEAILREVEDRALEMGIDPYKMRSTDGTWLMTPLLLAKAQTLHALALINQKGS